MGDESQPARSNTCRHMVRRNGRPRPALMLAALAAVGWTAASPVQRACGEPSLQMHLVQAGGADFLQITVAPTVTAVSASQVPFSIRVGPVDVLPKNSFLRVRGLPPTVSLSGGYVTAPGAWSVPINALPTLRMVVPAGVVGRSDISISLVTEDGAQLAQVRTILVVQSPPEPPPQEATAEPPRVQSPPMPRAPILSPADREAAERLIARGALLLAATYDPRELARWGAQGIQPSLGEARKWYERARELGAPEAEGRLARLGGG